MHFSKTVLAVAAALFASALAENVQIAYTIGETYYTQDIPLDVYTPLTEEGQMTTLQNNGRCLLFPNGNSAATEEVMKGSHVFNPPVMVAGVVCHNPSIN